jgi:uncharacterized protein with ParB-like and HNH nuclease domain
VSTIREAKTIRELFSQQMSIDIPPYQRAYSWVIKQWNQFIGDLQDQKSGKPYHFGQFIFETPNGGPVFVVDGQAEVKERCKKIYGFIDKYLNAAGK